MCTSFVSYYQKPIFGWNYDYSPADIYFSVLKEGDQKSFGLFTDFYGNKISCLRFNSHGLFVCMNALPDPKMRYNLEKSDRMFPMIDLWEKVSFLKSANEAKELFRDKVLSYYPLARSELPGPALHYLFADRSGEAFVLEYDEEKTFITPIQGKHLVMTNFANCKDLPAMETPFNGRYRYLYAMDYLDKHKNNFTLEEGIRMLTHTQQCANWKTLISMAFDVDKQSIYFSLNRRNNTLFKLNLAEGVITGLGKIRQKFAEVLPEDYFDLKKLEKYF